MAKLVGREFSRVLTTVRGTIGYLAPEWISGSIPVTAKADVYSYGMAPRAGDRFRPEELAVRLRGGRAGRGVGVLPIGGCDLRGS
jgi:serine/threonine protein kinase